jgi:hypothetical protein
MPLFTGGKRHMHDVPGRRTTSRPRLDANPLDVHPGSTMVYVCVRRVGRCVPLDVHLDPPVCNQIYRGAHVMSVGRCLPLDIITDSP